jgi:hypothetical protein
LFERSDFFSVAQAVLKWLDPYLDGRKPLIGGPAVEGFPNFWWDWPWRFVNEIDDALIGFVDWHRYADWRDAGENGAPQDGGLTDAAKERDMVAAQMTPAQIAEAQGLAANGSPRQKWASFEAKLH